MQKVKTTKLRKKGSQQNTVLKPLDKIIIIMNNFIFVRKRSNICSLSSLLSTLQTPMLNKN